MWQPNMVGNFVLELSDCVGLVQRRGERWCWEVQDLERRTLAQSRRLFATAVLAQLACCRRIRGGRPQHAAEMDAVIAELERKERENGQRESEAGNGCGR